MGLDQEKQNQHPTGYTKEQLKARKKFMGEFETTYADASYTGMGNRDKEFMDKIKFDMKKVPDKFDDPLTRYPDVTQKVQQEAPPTSADQEKQYHQPVAERSEAYKKFVQTYGTMPNVSSQYGGQASVPLHAHISFKDIPMLEKEKVEQDLEEKKLKMTQEEYYQIKKELRPSALPQTDEDRRRHDEFVRSMDYNL